MLVEEVMCAKWFGRYKVLGEVGRGRFSTLLAVEDSQFGQVCALKVWSPRLTADLRFRLAFRRVLPQVAGLWCERVAAVYDFGEAQGCFFMTRQLLRVPVLGELLPVGGMGMSQAVRVLSGVAEGLSVVHGAGLVHGDLRLEHVFVGDDGGVVLTDVGLNWLIDQPPVCFTPEQLAGRAVTPRTDVHQLGQLLVMLLVGKRLTVAQGRQLTRYCAGVPRQVERVLGRALSERPQVRFATAVGFVAALREAVVGVAG